jgi:hypothetical protein
MSASVFVRRPVIYVANYKSIYLTLIIIYIHLRAESWCFTCMSIRTVTSYRPLRRLEWCILKRAYGIEVMVKIWNTILFFVIQLRIRCANKKGHWVKLWQIYLATRLWSRIFCINNNVAIVVNLTNKMYVGNPGEKKRKYGILHRLY